jgi:hypothetical protein
VTSTSSEAQDLDFAILAGGAGSGLGALGRVLPKAAYPIGLTPLLVLQLAQIVRTAGFGPRSTIRITVPVDHPRLTEVAQGWRYADRLTWIQQERPARAAVALQAVNSPCTDRPLLAMVGDAFFPTATLDAVAGAAAATGTVVVGLAARDADVVGPIVAELDREGTVAAFGPATGRGAVHVDGGLWAIPPRERTHLAAVHPEDPDRIVGLWNAVIARGSTVSAHRLRDDLHLCPPGASDADVLAIVSAISRLAGSAGSIAA